MLIETLQKRHATIDAVIDIVRRIEAVAPDMSREDRDAIVEAVTGSREKSPTHTHANSARRLTLQFLTEHPDGIRAAKLVGLLESTHSRNTAWSVICLMARTGQCRRENGVYYPLANGDPGASTYQTDDQRSGMQFPDAS